MTYKKLFSRSLVAIVLIVSSIAVIETASAQTARGVMTKRLFTQNQRVFIEFPMLADGAEPQVLSEEVQYTHSDNRSKAMTEQEELAVEYSGQVAHLKAIEVVGKMKSNFAPERNGKVAVDFIIRVPKELLSDDWKVKLSPILLHNDSIVALDEVVIKGIRFFDVQKEGYDAYAKYTGSIVDDSDYDKVFIDQDNIDRDIQKRQEFYLQQYELEWAKVVNFNQKKAQLETRSEGTVMKKEEKRIMWYYNQIRSFNEKAYKSAAKGKDTTGSYVKFMKGLNSKNIKKKEGALQKEVVNVAALAKKYDVPLKADGTPAVTPQEVQNHVMTRGDSLNIAKNRYQFEDIARNEMKREMAELEKKRMIVFPYDSKARIDSVVSTEKDFIFYYNQEYAVGIGLDKLAVTVTGSITARDHSGYQLQATDTLGFMISSLAQLADSSLAVKETRIYKNMYDKINTYPKFTNGRATFSLAYQDNTAQMDEFISRYNKYANNSDYSVDSVVMTGSQSLDGTFDANAELSMQRVESVHKYLVSNHPQIAAKSAIRTEFIGEDWSGLARMIRSSRFIQHKDEILNLMTNAVYPDETESEIKKLYSKDYQVMYDSLYPKLRRVDYTVYISRPAMESTDSVIREEKVGYIEGVRLLRNKQYIEALEILSEFPDFNAALALTCLGYNGRAYDLLLQLKATHNTEYLMAIITKRMGLEGEVSAQHLLNATKLDVLKAFRSKLDPEIAGLVKDFNLQPQLEKIMAGDKADELFTLDYAKKYGRPLVSTQTPSTATGEQATQGAGETTTTGGTGAGVVVGGFAEE